MQAGPPPGAPGGPGGGAYPGAPGGPPGGYPDPRWQPQAGWQQAPPRNSLGTALAFVPLLAIPVGLLVPERGVKFWDGTEAWSVLALLCALIQLAPLLASTFSWSPPQAWRIAAVGVGGLALFWVLLVLPGVGRNTSFALTVGTAAAAAALWLAPGRPR